MSSALINVPSKAKRGEVIAIKTLISHKMETGFRYTDMGAHIPRDIITGFVATYNGEEIFSAELHPAIAANPLSHKNLRACGRACRTFTDRSVSANPRRRRPRDRQSDMAIDPAPPPLPAGPRLLYSPAFSALNRMHHRQPRRGVVSGGR